MNPQKPILTLDFTPSDAIMDPIQPVIYLTDGAHNRVVAFNYQTGIQSYLSLGLKPEHLTFANGELFVTLLKSTHQYYTQAPLNGAIAIVNPQTMTLADQLDIETDPYGIAVDQKGFIYITPGSNQWAQMLVYSRATKQKVSSFNVFRHLSLAMLQPGTDKLYTQGTDSNALGIYRLVNQNVVKDRYYVYTFDQISTPMRFSPDGQYLFNGSGEVLDANFQYVTFIDSFSDIAFDPVSKHFYASVKSGNSIKEYAFDNKNSDGLDKIKSIYNYQSTGQVSYLFYRDSLLLAVSKNSTGGYFIETISVPARDAYDSNPYFKQIIPLNFTPTQTIIDPQKPVLYMTDQTNNKVYAINYANGEVKSVQLDLPPERIAYENDELYVTLLKGSIQHDGYDVPGSIQILNAGTLQPVDRLDLSFKPAEVVAKDGNIIVIPGENSSGQITSYSSQTKQVIANGGFLRDQLAQIHPTLPRIYTSGTFDMNYVNIQDGKLSITRWPKSNDVSSFDPQKNFRISPYGNYIFNGNGEVYDQDLNHVDSLGYSFNDFAFSVDSKRVYAANSKMQVLHIYDEKESSNTFSEVGALTTLGQTQSLFCRDNQLISVSNNQHREVVTTPSWIEFLPLQPDVNDGNLTIRSAFPTAGSKDNAINTPVVLRFNNQIFVGDPTDITIKDANGQIVKTNISLQAVNNLLFLKFDHELNYGSTYTITVPGNAGVDANGQGFASQPYSLNFTTGQEFNRLGGYDLYDTAVKISQEGWQQADTVVLATGNGFQDALSAAPLAKKYAAPILLTTRDTLPAQVAGEIERLKARQVIIVGGNAVISPDIETGMQAKGIKTVRLAGYDCYATSVEIANYLGPTSQIFLATGNNFPDALSIAPYAANHQIPILLTPKDHLSPEAKNYLKHNRITKTYIVGGNAVISDNISYELVNAERIAGYDAYETNLAVLEKFDFDFSQTFIATGENFPDALAGSALAGMGGNPIVLLSNRTNQNVIDTLRANKGTMKMKYTLGGEAVVPSSLLTKVFGQ